LIGTTVSHYRILERLGGGGMGVVYKAVDLKLDRPVALKFLASQRGAAEEHKRRFLREARTASALDHPNICTIYEVDETADGALFIAMALCEGETLRDRIARGPLPLAEAVAIAGQIAAGLGRAHERGIVHRDVKPANVMVAPGGGVKLVDFGIAKLADQSRLTRAGAAVGTAGYMSPEQLRGEPSDPRSDVWSLGVVIYEMVTGQTPFESEAENEMIRAILKRDPRPMAALRPGVPGGLERLVERALAKRPEERTPDMATMSAGLQEIATVLASRRPDSDSDRTLRALPAPPSSPALQGARPGGGEREGTGERGGNTGNMVGHYEILEILGGGGMGIVYRARDTRLARVVALKFLPPELTRDPQAKERFEQEARAASSLDHPNLCTILELGETPDGRLYLAMPCYDGETLRRRIEGGPLPVDEAIDIALQIARGLAKAHRNGIIHRDIKPANLIVTSDGVVKILDFGLAKLAGSAAISQTGSSAGTPAYMSPEQARGDEVDARTDLWSLGVVLYELLSGRRPFRGEREQAVIYSILHEKPQPLRELRPEVSPELARIVERLIAKEPAERYPSVEEALGDLRVLRGEPATGFTRAVEPARAQGSPWLGLAVAAVIVVGTVLTALAIFLPRRGESRGAPVQTAFSRLTEQEGRASFPSVSPDGRDFVYVKLTSPGNLDIYSQRIGGSNPRNLTADSPRDDTQPAFSPDGGTIAFRSDREGGGIFLMGATGESVRRLTDFGYNPAWSPDGRELLVATEGISDPQVRKTKSEIWRVDIATPDRRRLAEGDAVQPSWSPHGQRIAYWGIPTGSGARALDDAGRGRRAGPGRARRLPQLEPGLVAGRALSLLFQQSGRQHEHLAGADGRELRPGARRAGADHRSRGVERPAQPSQGRQENRLQHAREPGEPRAGRARSGDPRGGTSAGGDPGRAGSPFLRRFPRRPVGGLLYRHPPGGPLRGRNGWEKPAPADGRSVPRSPPALVARRLAPRLPVGSQRQVRAVEHFGGRQRSQTADPDHRRSSRLPGLVARRSPARPRHREPRLGAPRSLAPPGEPAAGAAAPRRP
jgi:serine/threonine protein kinase